MQKRLIQQRGQGMTEYIVIVALIAVAAIAVTQLFGSTIRNQMAGVAQEVAGKDGKEAIKKAGEDADKAKEAAAKNTNLSNYGGQKDAGSGGGATP